MTPESNCPIISVVVPVYNIEDYVSACLDSLLRQDMPDFEVIVVDDDSTDSSFGLCQRYMQNPSVRVFTKQHGGLSAARNFGVEKARGRYVVFVDGDDVVAPQFLSTLYQATLDSNAEMSVVGFEQCPDQETYISANRPIGQVDVYTTKEAVAELLLSRAITVSACGKLAPRRFWQNHPFPIGAVYEDLATTVKVLIECSKIAVIDAALYGQVNRRGSLTRQKKYSSKQLRDYFQAVKSCSETVQNCYGSALSDEVLARRMIEYTRIDRLIRDQNILLELKVAKEVRNRVRAYLWRNLGMLLISPRIPFGLKAQALLNLGAPGVYSRFFLMRQRSKMR